MLLETLQKFAALLSNKQREYFEACLQGAHIVSCKPMAEVLPEDLLRYVKQLKIIPKQCYKNATLIAGLDDEIHFVDGKMDLYGLPIDHAWNEYRGQYFDATKEIALSESPEGCEYLSMGEFTYHYVMNICIQREFYGSVLYETFSTALHKA